MDVKESISAVIVDDSGQARKLLQLMLNDLKEEIQVKGAAESLDEGVELIKQHRPDVVFLDIEMPGKSGLEIVNELPKTELNYEIIFTTAYNQFAVQAFRLSAIDYLLKPIKEAQLAEAIEKIKEAKSVKSTRDQRLQALIESLENSENLKISIPTSGGFELVEVNAIMYVKAEGSYAKIVLNNQSSKLISKNLKFVESKLVGIEDFMRPHRSYLINVKYIKSFDRADRGIITMEDGEVISLARDRREDFFQLYFN